MNGRYIGLALQGGGSYAAFTAGALRALLRPQRKLLAADEIHSISGTSGGALNAVLLGLAIQKGERKPWLYVDQLWELNQIESLLKARFPNLRLLPDQLLALTIGEAKRLKERAPRITKQLAELSKTNDYALNCIKSLLHHAAPDLPEDPSSALLENRRPFVTIAATEVRTGMAHYFTNNAPMIRKFERFNMRQRYDLIKTLCLSGLFASVAHPSVFNAVPIDENLYWDGYYSSNPPFMHLFREGCDEVILIRLVQQRRKSVGEDAASVRDRIEEIIQNTAPNMEIMMYLAMREILANNSERLSGVQLKMSPRRLTRRSVFHEIRLLKSGNIGDEGYPLSALVEKLTGLGERAVGHRKGFAATYRGTIAGLQIITEVDFETEEVRTEVLDLDKLLFEETAEEEDPFPG